jgi:hypothetical protein
MCDVLQYAVCGVRQSARLCLAIMRQCAQQCAAVRQCGSVRQSGSEHVF